MARYRVTLPARMQDILIRTEDRVRIRGTRYQRFVFRGVPGRHADCIVAEAIFHHLHDNRLMLDVVDQQPQRTDFYDDEMPDIVIEAGEKIGRYDGAARRRYALRPMTDPQQLAATPWADIRIIDADDELTVIIRPRDDAAPIVDFFPRLRASLDDYNLASIVRWHAKRWFTHLAPEEIEEIAASWEMEVKATGMAGAWTLNEANRAASRRLYKESRERGWRKLTIRERVRLGFAVDSPQWRTEQDCARAYELVGTRLDADGYVIPWYRAIRHNPEADEDDDMLDGSEPSMPSQSGCTRHSTA